MSRSRIPHSAELAIVALLGGAVALGGAALFGKLDNHTTIQQVSPLGTGSLGNIALTQPPTHGPSSEQIYKRDAPGVVQITATTVTTTPADPFGFTPAQKQTEQSLGSGFVIDKAGHIVTNEHVIAGASKVQVSFSGNDQITATVVGKDTSSDIEVLKIDTRMVGDAVVAQLGQRSRGRPGVCDRTTRSATRARSRRASSQRCSARSSRQQRSPRQRDPDRRCDQPRQLGRPAARRGRPVIGVTSRDPTGNTGQQGNIGIGFAVPVNTVRNAPHSDQVRRRSPVIISVLPISTRLAQLQPAGEEWPSRRGIDPLGRREAGLVGNHERDRAGQSPLGGTSSFASTACPSRPTSNCVTRLPQKPAKVDSISSATARSAPSP
jgi:S1-C subfamily serine protease